MKTTIQKLGEGTEWEAIARWSEMPLGDYGLRIQFRNKGLNPKTEFADSWRVPLLAKEGMESAALAFWRSIVRVFQTVKQIPEPKWYLVEPTYLALTKKSEQWIKENGFIYRGWWIALNKGTLLEASQTKIVRADADLIAWIPKENK